MSSFLVTIKRYDDKFLEELAKGLEQTCWKASGNDNATVVVSVYEILPTNCMRKVYYHQRKKLAGGMSAPWLKIPYAIRGRAVEAAIGRMLFASATMRRHKRYEKGGIVCYTDLSDSKRMIEIKDTNTGRRLVPQNIHFKGTLCRSCTIWSSQKRKRRTFDKLLFQRAGMAPQRF
jgi:hypothetical protein